MRIEPSAMRIEPPAEALVAGPPLPTRAQLLLLVGLSALAPLSLQIFIPALPTLQRHFAVTPGTAQLTLSLAILANAIATLAYGPLADRFGRRPALLTGLAAFLLGSAIAAVAPTIGLLIFGRILQSMGGAAGLVLARAIVRDLYAREKAASVIAYLTVAMVVVPMLAPVLGAVIIDLSSWRGIFVLVAVAAALLLWQTHARLIETRPAGAAAAWGSLLIGAGQLIRAPAFWAYVLQSAFAISLFFAFISGAPYFVIDVLGRSTTEYGLYFIMVSFGYMGGNLISGRYAGRIGVDRLIVIGSLGAVAAAVLAFLLLLGLPWTPLALFAPMFLGALANGLSMPNAQAGAISVDPLLAGTASGLAGFLQMTAAAAVSQAVGVLQNGTPYPMLTFMLTCALLSLLGFLLPQRLAHTPAA